jgi:ABC-2 type transport system ATP-binding protein/lipopolysaccharide transport system ATP-binding protein
VPSEKIRSLKEFTIRSIVGRTEYTEFWALKDVSCSVNRGEMVGIVGRNGAGKSTLLKVIARVMKPRQGKVYVSGTVAPLIELGTGFDTELTGRENIYLNGSIFGFGRREMDKKFDNIVEFSELGSFIDAPLRTYSSGMVARLGFAIATDVDPDVLILDEILSVGDVGFQRKCKQRIEAFTENGVAILFVSHNMVQVNESCSRALWLEQGRAMAWGNTSEVTDK